MRSKADRVRAAITSCSLCFEAIGKDLWKPTERVEQLWFEVEARLDAIEDAEEQDDPDAMRENLTAILQLVNRIEVEMPD